MPVFVMSIQRRKLIRSNSINGGYKILLAIFMPISFLYAPNSLAGFFEPSLSTIEGCINARALTGKELISKSIEHPYFVYFNGKGDTVDHMLVHANGLAGYIGPYFSYEKSLRIKDEQQMLLSGTIYVRDPSIFEKYLGGNKIYYSYEIRYVDERFLLYRDMLESQLASFCKEVKP